MVQYGGQSAWGWKMERWESGRGLTCSVVVGLLTCRRVRRLHSELQYNMDEPWSRS
jgi:hypothetical protein